MTYIIIQSITPAAILTLPSPSHSYPLYTTKLLTLPNLVFYFAHGLKRISLCFPAN
jgi:hypothetical protein